MSRWIRNWFSNMILCDNPFSYQGIEYKTVENFYQAMKLPKDDLVGRAYIASLEPHKSKKEIRKYKLRDDWSDVLKIAVMRYGLKQKFTKDSTHGKQLISTYSEEIIETNNWHDNYWGNCICDKCSTIQGTNALGKILMSIRLELVMDTER